VKPTHLLGAAAAAAVLTLASITVSVSVTAPAVAAAASQDDTVQTSMGPLVIHPVHHAGLVLTWNGKRIVADPTTFPPGPNSGAAAFRGPPVHSPAHRVDPQETSRGGPRALSLGEVHGVAFPATERGAGHAA